MVAEVLISIIVLYSIAICLPNVNNVETDCYLTERCTTCKNNFAPPTCCECSEGFELEGNECKPPGK